MIVAAAGQHAAVFVAHHTCLYTCLCTRVCRCLCTYVHTHRRCDDEDPCAAGRLAAARPVGARGHWLHERAARQCRKAHGMSFDSSLQQPTAVGSSLQPLQQSTAVYSSLEQPPKPIMVYNSLQSCTASYNSPQQSNSLHSCTTVHQTYHINHHRPSQTSTA